MKDVKEILTEINTKYELKKQELEFLEIEITKKENEIGELEKRKSDLVNERTELYIINHELKSKKYKIKNHKKIIKNTIVNDILAAAFLIGFLQLFILAGVIHCLIVKAPILPMILYGEGSWIAFFMIWYTSLQIDDYKKIIKPIRKLVKETNIEELEQELEVSLSKEKECENEINGLSSDIEKEKETLANLYIIKQAKEEIIKRLSVMQESIMNLSIDDLNKVEKQTIENIRARRLIPTED